MKMWNKKFLAAAVAFSAMTGQVYAAETAHTGEMVDELMPTYSLGEVVVTATRSQKRDVDVPAATTVITAKEIEESGAANVSDVLAKINGFTYKAFGPNGASMGTMTNELNMRGMKNGALVLMNGNPISWRGKYNLDAIPASSIERIEIVKGNGSVLYGSEAMSGVVNIITKKKTTNEVHTGFGNYGQRSYGASVGDEKFGVYYNFDKFGRRDGISYTDVLAKDKHKVVQFEGETRTDVRDIKKESAGFTYQLNPHLDFLLNYYESEVKYNRTITRVDVSKAGLRVGEAYNSRKYTTKQYVSQLNYKDRDWKGSLYFNTGTTESIGPTYISSLGKRTPTDWYNTREKNTTYGMDVQHTWHVGENSTAIAGFDLEHEVYAILPAHSTKSPERYMRNNWGLFGQWEQRFDTRNTGILGLRETWTTGAARGQNYSNLSASAQWLHKLDRDSSIYLNVSQSFLMPTFGQMYGNTKQSVPSPNLKPQTGINYEFGWKKNHHAHTWKAAIFRMRIKDYISPKWEEKRAEYQYKNEDFRNIGIELADEIRGTHGFSYHWGVTWQNPETRSSNNTYGWDRTFGKIQLTGGIAYQKDKWTSSFTASYLAARVVSPSSAHSSPTKPYLLTTWNTSYTPDEHSEISLRIDNLLDRNDTTMHSGARYYCAPINYLLSYSYRF